MRVVFAQPHVHRIPHPTFVTIASAPLEGARWPKLVEVICPTAQVELLGGSAARTRPIGTTGKSGQAGRGVSSAEKMLRLSSLRASAKQSSDEAARFWIASSLSLLAMTHSNKCIVNIIPIGINFLNQRQLPRAVTGFDLFLARDCIDHGLVQLVPNKYFAAISRRETFSQTVAMFEGALGQIGCDACVKRSIALVGNDVNARLSH
jgi:hypothetical protein